MVTVMEAPGPLLAQGRDADIFEYGAGRVLRRARSGRSMAGEFRAMEYLAGQGYPVPKVHELSEDGSDLVMERISGPTMLEAFSRAPWRLPSLARTLGRLHLDLHEIAAPEFLPPAPVGAGSAIVHLDLHPLNVLMGPSGPVVIDWTAASRGDADVDVALAWLLVGSGEVGGGWAKRTAIDAARRIFLREFLGQLDRAGAAASLAEALEWKARDANMSKDEVARMRTIVGSAGPPAR
jgi:aminoglycoside phosphotransferase (APT) family kinase protein